MNNKEKSFLLHKDRSAVDTIKGYFYQFDYSIKKILECLNDKDVVTIEGIEDIDIGNVSEEIAIQCKYFSKTEYNHSVIAKPIRLMLKHFISGKKKGNSPIKYCIYGHYKGGQNKLKLPISVNDLKTHFLTYTEKKISKKFHEDIFANDDDLKAFLINLKININAPEYNEQLKLIINLFKDFFKCNDFEAEYFYYNNSLNEIKKLAIKENIEDRKISKFQFLKKINYKIILFNKWYIEYKGLKNYFKELRHEYFTGLNSSPFDRFFLIEVDMADYLRFELKELIFSISGKWSKLSRRESNTFCPYIFIKGIDEFELINLKKELDSENFYFIDGFHFEGSDFNVKRILIKPDYNNSICVKFLNKLDYIDQTLSESTNTKEIFQFYYETPYYNCDSVNVKHVKIQIQKLKQIKEII